jgi:hypothetical protein
MDAFNRGIHIMLVALLLDPTVIFHFSEIKVHCGIGITKNLQIPLYFSIKQA